MASRNVKLVSSYDLSNGNQVKALLTRDSPYTDPQHHQQALPELNPTTTTKSLFLNGNVRPTKPIISLRRPANLLGVKIKRQTGKRQFASRHHETLQGAYYTRNASENQFMTTYQLQHSGSQPQFS